MNSSPPLLADDVVIGLRGISTRFGKAVIHENLDLDVYKGEILGLIGGSGTGKSVLLQTILGLITQAEGTVTILDVCMNTATNEERDRVRQHWGVLFQDGALFSSLTVGENIKFPLKEFTSLRKGMIERIARMKLDLVGLPQTAFGKYPSELSGGMRKRAGLARALVMDPEILLLDEPTAGLDPLGANAFDELVLTMRDTMGLTVVIVTHDLDTLYTTCSRVAVLAEKRIFAADSIENLLTIDYPWINDYFNGPRGRAAYGSYLSGKAKKTETPA